MKTAGSNGTRKLLILSGAVLLLASMLVAWLMQARQPKLVALVPTLTGQAEYCLTCHAGLPQISPSHPVEQFGCVICHGGEALALDADLAHSSMRGGANPSDLAVVEQSCGGSQCHSGSAADDRDHIQRVMTSVQSTYSGALASMLYTFGAQPDLTARFGMHAVTDDSITTTTGVPALQLFDTAAQPNPSIQAFAANCVTCHINGTPQAGKEYARFTGCASCHTPGAAPITQDDMTNIPQEQQPHQLTTAIPYTQCNTCHNRGNYDLRTMTFVPRTDTPADRLHDYYQPIAQFTKCEYTLDCIDCHTRGEAMGDGDIHSSKKEVQYTQCKSCHGTPTELPLTRTLSDPNDIAFRLADLNFVAELNVGDTILVTDRGEPLWNTRLNPDGTYKLISKADGRVFTFKPVLGSGCTQDPAQQGSQACHECHAVER
jgi:hypothetical protein